MLYYCTYKRPKEEEAICNLIKEMPFVIHSFCDFGPAGRSIKSTGRATNPPWVFVDRNVLTNVVMCDCYDKTVLLSLTLWSRVESLAYSDRVDAAYEHDQLISQFV